MPFPRKICSCQFVSYHVCVLPDWSNGQWPGQSVSVGISPRRSVSYRFSGVFIQWIQLSSTKTKTSPVKFCQWAGLYRSDAAAMDVAHFFSLRCPTDRNRDAINVFPSLISPLSQWRWRDGSGKYTHRKLMVTMRGAILFWHPDSRDPTQSKYAVRISNVRKWGVRGKGEGIELWTMTG